MGKVVGVQKSSGDVHVYSTLANPQIFVVYAMPDANDASQMGRLPVEAMRVVIKGGAGVASKNLITALGVRTTITPEEYDAIQGLEHFQGFVKSGHITVERKEYDIDKIVGDMNPRDPGGPLTPADFAQEPADGTRPLPVDLQKAGNGWVANQLGR